MAFAAASFACTPGDEGQDPSEAAEGFVASWSERDGAAMAEFFDEETAAEWSGTEVDAFIDDVMESGEVRRITVSVKPGTEDEEEGTYEAPFTIEYVSAASRAPVEFEGELAMTLDEEAAVWRVAWSPELMFPGVEGATGFKVTSRWPERGSIVDRRGRRVAVGDAENRRYPFGSVAGSTVGHLEPLSRKDAASDPVRRKGDLVGASGLEEALEELLMGRPETTLAAVDATGETLETLGSRPAKKARPVKVTLDMEVQRAAEQAYGDTTGGAVLIEPSSGDLLAIVSSAPFDPNNYVGVADIEPFNRALSGLYPPGSAMKVVTAGAALETKTVTATSRVTGPDSYLGVRNFESGEFGEIDFATAMRNSVNTAFAQIAEDLGPRQMTRFAEAFGFNEEPGMPLAAASSSFPPPEDLSDLMWGSIGQAQVLATPLQMASVVQTVADDGERIDPRILMTGETTSERVLSPRTAKVLTRLMEGVVQSGTGTAANLGSAIPVAGKTGTAEVGPVGDIQNHAWFVCFAPPNDPKVALAVVSELGGVGGQVAAPLARGILQAVLPKL